MPGVLHPIVAQLMPNREQVPAVQARGRDVVVTAGAGTGKTRTLVARYLSLLAEGKPLRSIVAITFTRKAAREMRNRIRAEVQHYLASATVTAEERDYWQAVYAGLDAARIGTIHSLCSEILRAHPAEAAVDPRFQVMEEGQAALLRREVLDTALAWAADEPEVVGLFRRVGGAAGLRGVLQTLLERRLDSAEAFDAVSVDPLGQWRQALEQRQRRCLDAVLSDPAWSEAVGILLTCEPSDPDDALALQRRRALQALEGARVIRPGDNKRLVGRGRDGPSEGAGSTGQVGTGGDDGVRVAKHASAERVTAGGIGEGLTALSRLDEINLSGGSYRAWPAGKAEKAAVKDALRTLRRLWREHAWLLALELTPLDDKLAQAVPSLEAAFRFSCRRYQEEKQKERALDFDDLESGAVELLHDQAAVRARWQGEVEGILVDEFQDTNARQRDLVRLLGAETGELFVVGDAKQSIYGFRGADVTVFRSERERIARRGGEDCPLATSYRAHRGLVSALNQLLRPVLGEGADPERPWAEPFAPIEPFREDPGPGFEAPYVEFHLTVGSKAEGALDRAAEALVGRVAEMVEGGAQVMDKGERRSVTYGDVAILCRASTSFGAYEDALDEAGLPYLTVAGRGFYDRPEIRDVLNALRALSDPTDDLALMGLLRSPVVGLSDAAIYRLVEARGDGSASLWETLLQGGGDLGDVAERRAARVVSLVRELHTMAQRTEVGGLLKAFLDDTNYLAALYKAGQDRAVRNVHKLLGDAHASGLVRVGAFLEYLEGLQDSGAREGEARALVGGAVQIMSVHQAKGLEFPIVVLGDATWGGRGGVRGVLTDPALGVLMPLSEPDNDELPAIYRLARARDADHAAAEADRLLYVAATRAREKLLVSGCLAGIKKDGTPHKLTGWLGQLGGPLGLGDVVLSYDEQGNRVHRIEFALEDGSVACFVYEPGWIIYRPADTKMIDETAGTRIPLPPPLLAPVAQRRTTTRVDGGRRVGRVVPDVGRSKAPAWVVGRLVHEALATWRLPASGDGDSLTKWLHARARAAGLVNRHRVKHAVRRSRRLLLRFRAHRLFKDLEAAEQRLHEVPFSLEQRGLMAIGRIDLLYRRGSRWTIVEFKSDEIRSREGLERVLREKDYVEQARRYTGAAEQLLGSRPLCLLCFLDFEGGVRIFSVPETGSLRAAEL